MNNNWGYCPGDHHFKPAPLLIKKLVECVSKGGNMILNVGPDGDGSIPPESVEILSDIGAWMAKNSESIRHCGPAAMDKPEFGRITRNGNRLYFHIFENTLGALPLLGLQKAQVESLRLLDGNRPIPVSTSWVHSDYPEILFADLGEDPVLPDPVDTVLEVHLKG
jgi:alpha-L-fucosidase